MSVLDALGPIPRSLITLDFEAFYSSTYHLMKRGGSGLTTEEYVRDPRFEVLGVGVKVGSRPSVWMEEADFKRWAASVPWSSVRCLAQHAHLEGLILSHHYGIRPGFWLDTLSMSRALHGPAGHKVHYHKHGSSDSKECGNNEEKPTDEITSHCLVVCASISF